MFINKFSGQTNLNPSKMTSYINLFLKTEVTCIPKLLHKFLGDYYNNALCNGATWVFGLWCVVHLLFDKSLDALCKKLRYKEYVRLRLKSSLWFLGFYSTALVYCGATLSQNEIELFNFKKMHVPSSTSLPTQVILGYTLISTFYLQSSFWDGLINGSAIAMINYFFLFIFLVSSYILRVVEISFTLTALISIAQIALEVTRCCLTLSSQDLFLFKLINVIFFVATLTVYIAVYIIVIPLTFIVPLGLKIMSDYPNILLLFLFFNLTLWLTTEIYQSILFKFMNHWLFHKVQDISAVLENSETSEQFDCCENLHKCSSGILECSLFKPRDDISYNLKILKEEAKARKTKMMRLRKPKNVFVQTLKYMVAIKKKLNAKHRVSENSDSEVSEGSENGSIKLGKNSEDKIENLQSDKKKDSEEKSECEDDIDLKEKSDHANLDQGYAKKQEDNVMENTSLKKVETEKSEEKNSDHRTDTEILESTRSGESST